MSSITAPLALVRDRATARLAAAALAALVVASAAVRAWVAVRHAGPAYFPDEYLYTELSRSIAATGRPLARGETAHFAPLLAPIVTAPAWLAGSVETGYHAAQAINSLVASLAAIPVYVLARTVKVGRALAVAAAALALLLPGLLYTSFMLSEPIAYPLVLGAVACGVRAIVRPTRRNVAALVALTLLASFARLQFAVLAPCFIAAFLLVLAREQRVRETLLRHWRAATAVVVSTAALAAAGPARSTGYYPSFLHVGVHPLHVLSELALNVLVLMVGTGLVLLPGAVLALVGAFEKPLRREQVAFASTVLTVTVALLLQASIYGDTDVAQTRYAFYLVPLWIVAFALYAQQGWPRRRFYALGGFALVTCILSSPLTTIAAAHGKVHSPELFAVGRLQELVHDNAGTASVAILAGLAVAVLAAGLTSLVRPRAATVVALAGAACVMVATSVAAYSFDGRNTRNVRDAFAGSSPSWVDALHLGPARMIVLPNDLRTDSLEQLFWNRSVDRVTMMPTASPIDMLPVQHGSFAHDGTVLSAGKPTTGPVLLDEYGSSVQVRDAVRLGAGPTSVLYRPHGTLRLRLLAVGEYHDHWLANRGGLVVFPNRSGGRIAGRVVFAVQDPLGARTATLSFRGRASFDIRSGETRVISVPVCGHGTTVVDFHATTTGQLQDGRLVSVHAMPPRFVADRHACTTS